MKEPTKPEQPVSGSVPEKSDKLFSIVVTLAELEMRCTVRAKNSMEAKEMIRKDLGIYVSEIDSK